MILLTVYCLLIVGASLFGGFVTSLIRLTHRRMQHLTAGIGGLMLGVGVWHQIPHALATVSGPGAINWCMGWMLAGLLLTFAMLRLGHVHIHAEPENEAPDGNDAKPSDCSHDHDHDHAASGRAVSWFGIFLGLSLHTLLDGVALAAHVQADSLHHAGEVTWLMGLGTFVGIFLHKPLDSLSITGLMVARGCSARWRHLINGGYSLMCPLGAMLFHWGVQQFSKSQAEFVSAGLAMSGGVFICIAMSDLLPEVDFSSRGRIARAFTVLLGVAAAWAIGLLEPEQAHEAAARPEAHKHEYHNHKHAQGHKY